MAQVVHSRKSCLLLRIYSSTFQSPGSRYQQVDGQHIGDISCLICIMIGVSWLVEGEMEASSRKQSLYVCLVVSF